jgi:hypothetical protein
MAAPERHTGSVQDAFGIVLFGVVAVATIVAVIAAVGSGGVYRQIGRGGFGMDGEAARARRPAPGSAVSLAERDDEVRQMLAARNARRVARGEAPLDVEAELARLTAPAAVHVDPGLEAEIRQLVVARNARRARQGKPPLDVDAEVARQVAELTAGGG